MKNYTLKKPETPLSLSVDYYKELNAEQYATVTSGNGPVLVIAGAGSGKTRTITYRVAWLLESGVRPEEILLVTFTNKAAKEMLHRVERLVGINISALWGGTYHHIGNVILRRHAKLIDYSEGYTILDATDSKDLIEMCVDELRIDTKKKRFPKGPILREIFSFSANTEHSLETSVVRKTPHFVDLIDEIKLVQEFYNDKKKQMYSMDFDDLLLNLRRLLMEHRDILDYYAGIFKHILVDEYQDTNKLQAELLDMFASKHRNILVVGDDSQSIYSFRGANFANIMGFPERYKDTKIFKLETNYRSVPQVLALANSSIKWNSNQFHKTLHPVRERGDKPGIVPVRDVFEQSEFLAQRVLELRNEGCSLNDIAVLYRAHFHSMELQLELTRRDIPFYVRSGLRFFEQAHVKDVLSFLRLSINPRDELSLKRGVRLFRGIGKAMADKLWMMITSSDNPAGVLLSKDTAGEFSLNAREGWGKFSEVCAALEKGGIKGLPSEQIAEAMNQFYGEYLSSVYPDYYERQQDIEQLSEYAKRFKSTDEFLSQMALLSEISGEDAGDAEKEDEVLTLSTIHQAKGLEWRYVFIIWLSEGRMPSPLSQSADEIEEERRLFYVGVTRAKEGLYMIYPQTIDHAHKTSIAKPSRFLKELDASTYEIWRVR